MLEMIAETNNRLAFSVEECAALTSISKAMLRVSRFSAIECAYVL